MCILPFLRFVTTNYIHLLDLHHYLVKDHVVPCPNFTIPHVAINHLTLFIMQCLYQ